MKSWRCNSYVYININMNTWIFKWINTPLKPWNPQNEALVQTTVPFAQGWFFLVNPKNHQDWIPGRVCKGKAVIWTDEHYVPWHFLGEAFFFIQAIISLDFTSLHWFLHFLRFTSCHVMSCHSIHFFQHFISFYVLAWFISFHLLLYFIPFSSYYCCISFIAFHFLPTCQDRKPPHSLP